VYKRSKGVFFLWLISGAILATAAILTPHPSGIGTHTQLGLGECTFLTTTGLPCPMCGMTTTFTHLAHLHFLTGLKTQPFGVLLFIATSLAFVFSTLELVWPRGRFGRFYRHVQRNELRWAFGLLGGLLLGWAYKVSIFKGWILF